MKNLKMKINGKDITAKPLDFNSVLEMQDMGGDIFAFSKKPFAVIRAYLAYCAGIDEVTAGDELEAHLVGGGDLAEIISAFVTECNDCAFFKVMVARGKAVEAEASENG